ncbi:MAG: 4-hydroxy-3-methylbut-2-enyl diphosphate reductase [Chloroflexota bacterium]
MEVVKAPRYAGFCKGVKRAWKLAMQEAASAGGPVYLSGKLIHNTPAMDELAQKGVGILDIYKAEGVDAGTPFILRAHGEGPEVYARAKELGLKLIDGTCGIVRSVQHQARDLEQQGFQVVLFGHRNHPEAKATIAHTKRGIIIESAQEAAELPSYPKVAAIAQTTSSAREYEKVCRILEEKCEQFENRGHICDFTQKAQDEALELAQQVEAMVVVGGRDSSNTRRLVEVCSGLRPTYHVETADELQRPWFEGISRVGVTAGASTRDEDIDAVISWLSAES